MDVLGLPVVCLLTLQFLKDDLVAAWKTAGTMSDTQFWYSLVVCLFIWSTMTALSCQTCCCGKFLLLRSKACGQFCKKYSTLTLPMMLDPDIVHNIVHSLNNLVNIDQLYTSLYSHWLSGMMNDTVSLGVNFGNNWIRIIKITSHF